ncbi:MAG: murein biosynthesis integral membrane protein MurJ [Polyangiaceae bacterium]|nr:murein biosynthesis integral membrane protein MurJ [Polyangiaceae bacterium]
MSSKKTENQKITGRAAIVAAGTLTSRILGLVRDQVLTGLFSRMATDAFLIAFQLPNLLRQLLAEGAVQNAVLPVLTEELKGKGEKEALVFFRGLIGVFGLILLGVSILGSIFAPELVQLFAKGFEKDPEQFELTVELTRWLFPYIFFMGSASLCAAALNTHKKFVATSFAPALLNLAFISSAFAFANYFEQEGQDRIFSLVVGALFGGAFQVFALWPSLKKIGYLRLPSLKWQQPAIRRVFLRLGPTLLGIGVYYVDVLVGRRLLSEAGEGSVTYFSMAMRLCDFPQGIFVMAMQTATLPSLAALFSQGKKEELSSTLSYALRLTLYVAIPATIGIVLLSRPIVQVVFGHGQFDERAVIQTAQALVAQGSAIFLVAIVRQVVAVFFAAGDTKTPVKIAAFDFLIFAAAAFLLGKQYGHVGISWAVSIASLAQAALLLFAARPYISKAGITALVNSTIKTALAALCASFAAFLGLLLSAHLLQSFFDSASQFLQAVINLGAGGLVFLLTYLISGALLKNGEQEALLGPLLRRIAR